MADVSIDSLQIQIESDSSKAEQSIRRLATSLTNLGTALNEVGRHERSVRWVTGSLASLNGLKFDGLKTAITRLRSLSQIDFKKNGTGLNAGAISEALVKISDAAQKLNGVNVKSTGVNTLINSVARLSEQGTNAQKAGDAIREMTDALKGMDQLQGIGENAQGAAKVVSTFTRLTNNMGKTDFADNIPKATEAIKGFITEMAQMPNVSDNTVRMAEALAQMAKSGKKAGSALQETSHVVRSGASSYQIAETIVNSYAEAWKTVFRLLKQIPSITLKAIKGSLSALKQLGSAGVSKLKEFASSLRNIKRESSGIGNVTMNLRNLLRIALGFRGIYGVFNFLKESVTAGADVAEVNHIVEETFGDMSEELKGWASTAIDKYGIAETAAKRYAGTLSAMFQASGTAQKDASKMAKDLVGLAGDLSSFFNIDTETAYNKIKSGMAGMVRPLRDLGIDLTATTLKEYALAQGITKSYAAMTQAEKVMLRYQYLMDVTKKQQGDFAATSNSMANAMRRLRAYVDSVKDALGQGLVAALRHVVSALNVVLRTVLRAANAFRVFMETLFGPNTSGNGIKVDTSDIEEISDDLSGADESASGTADGLDDAADSAKKLKKELSVLPFDELNQLNKAQEKESKTTGTGGGAGVLDGLVDTGTFDGIVNQMIDEFRGNELPDAISEWAERIKKAFTEHRWEDLGKEIAWGINQGIDYLYKLFDPAEADAKLNPWIDAFTTTLNSMLDDIHWYELGETFANGLNILLDKANRFFDETDWNLLGTSLAEWANGLVDNIDPVELGQFFANKLNVLWETAEGFVTEFHWDQLGTQLGLTAWELVSNINYDAMINTITTGLKGISSTVWNFANTFPWVQAGQLWAEKANKFIEKLPTEEIGLAVGKLTSGIIATLNQLFDPQKGIDFERLGIKFAIGMYAIVQSITPESLGGLLSNNFNAGIDFLIGAIDGLKDKADELGTHIGTVFKTAINGIGGVRIGQLLKDVWNTAWRYLKNAVHSLGNVEKGSGTGLGTIIHDAIVEIIDGIEFSDAVDTFTELVKKFAEDLSEIFGDTEKWGDFGSKVGQALVDIVTDKDLMVKIPKALDDMAAAFVEFVKKAIGKIWDNRVEIFNAFTTVLGNIDWFNVIPTVAAIALPIMAKSVGTLVMSGLKNAIINKFTVMFSEIGSSQAVATASGSIFSGLRSALEGEGGIIALIVSATAELQKFVDLYKGGNGMISEAGGAFDSYILKLHEVKAITGETKHELFLLKEEWESRNIDDSEFFSSFAKILGEAGVSAEQAKNMIKQLGGEMQLTDEQMDALKNAIKGIGTESDTAKSILESYGLTTKESIKGVTQAVTETCSEMDALEQVVSESSTNINEKFTGLVKSGGSFGEALIAILPYFSELEGGVDALRTNIDEQLGPGVFDELISSAGSASEKVDGITTSMGEAASETGKNTEEAKGYKKVADGLPDIISAVKGAFKNLISALIGKDNETTYLTEEDGKEQVEDYGTGMTTEMETSAENVIKAAETIAPGVSKALDDGNEKVKFSSQTLANIPGNVFQNKIKPGSPSKLFTELSESIPEGIVEGISNKESLVTAEVTSLCESIKETFSNEIESLKNSLDTDGEDAINNGLIDSMRNAINDNAYKVKDAVDTMANDMLDVVEGMENSFYSAGETLANSVASGFKSVHIPVPHLYVSEWIRHDNSDGSWFTTPNWNVSWYKKGGLFTKATIAGFGEAGDEAALPLENKRTMGRIANAITQNMDAGYGVSKADIISAIVQAEMMNSGNKQPVIINAELRTENNETLARAVIDGMNSIDYRNNATPQFGY